VGKTTTSINLAASLAQAGKKVLVADCDPQGNTTSGLGINKYSLNRTVYNLLMGECIFEDILMETQMRELQILPANIELSGCEIELVGHESREYILKNILSERKYLFDFVIIDCPPSLNLLTINALCAADTILVPIQCEYFALEGLTQLFRTIELVQQKLNPLLMIEGLVFTMFDARTNLSMQVVDEVKKHVTDTSIHRTIIPRNVRLSEAPSHGIPICLYDPRSKGAEAYELLADQVIDWEMYAND